MNIHIPWILDNIWLGREKDVSSNVPWCDVIKAQYPWYNMRGPLQKHRFNPGSRQSLGKANDNPLLYSCLENRIDRGAWRATGHGVTKNQTRLSH